MRRRYFVGKDYSNAYQKDFETLEKYNEGSLIFFFFFILIIMFCQISSIEILFHECRGMTKHLSSSVKLLVTSPDISFNDGTFIKFDNSIFIFVRRSSFDFSVRNFFTTIRIRFYYRKLTTIRMI